MDELTGDNALAIKAFLPLRWSLANPDDAYGRELSALENESLFKTFFTLEESRTVAGEAQDPHALELLTRLETKINLVLSLTTRIFTQTNPLPDRTPVALYADRLEWVGMGTPLLGDHLRVELYLNPQIPSACVFYGQVSEQLETGKGVKTVMQLTGLGEVVQDSASLRHS